MNYQFYPTPAELGAKLAGMLEMPDLPILEPSAGTGNLIEAFLKSNRFWARRYSASEFHCVELNPDRAATLKGKGYKVIWDDFLTFKPLTPYRTIIMNPPFHGGAKHLLKALAILADGGEIACLLNAETIKNPYTNERKDLIQQLENAENYQCEFIQSAFEDTDVEVALVYVKKKMEDFEFNERNILQLKADLTKNLFASVDAAIMKVWHNFTSRFSMLEYSQNIHYYNGWKTNNAFKCNRKVIIPLYAFERIFNEFNLMGVREELADIEKAMNYLDCGRTESYDMAQALQTAREQGITRNIDTKFFKVDVYKKGTAHLTFKDDALLKKFNLYCGRKLHWLPDDYGYKPYEALDDEERAVADSFEGRLSYRNTFNNRNFFLPRDANPLLLASG